MQCHRFVKVNELMTNYAKSKNLEPEGKWHATFFVQMGVKRIDLINIHEVDCL
jgi:hypothetical protein